MKIKKSEIKEIIRQTLNEITSGDIEELEAIVKELEGASKMHQGQSEQLAAASKMHKGQSERIDKIIKSVSKTEGKLTEKATGQYKVSPKVQMHWGMDKVVIISGNKRVVLNRKEMKSLMKGVKANKLTEGTCGYGENGQLGEEPAGPHLIKKKKMKEEVEPIGGMAKIAKIVKDKQHAKVGGQTVDMQSANLLMKLYNAVKDKDKEKMNKMNEKKLIMVLNKLWSRVKLKLPT